ncbi:MAG: YraN family protein [Verrucomicrobiota bacterium JB022]|nr:YraN family protein [Verrucomicrobiota bacterium JB022]
MSLAAHRAWYARRWQGYDTAARGRAGERLAAIFLQTKGFHVICRNWQRGHHEIDLVMRDADVLVFVEVRTRPADAFVPGFESLTRDKRRALRQGMEDYLRRVPRPPQTWRCDVVEVMHDAQARLRWAHYSGVSL